MTSHSIKLFLTKSGRIFIWMVEGASSLSQGVLIKALKNTTRPIQGQLGFNNTSPG